jgi:hypothetical protein
MTNMSNSKLKIDVSKIKCNYCHYKLKILGFKIRECNNNKPQLIRVELVWRTRRQELRDQVDRLLRIW